MAKGFKHGAGGGNLMNFQVVGNPRPETAKENTIWVDFDQINGWALRSSEPANPQIGMVWIGIGNASAAPFNALKKGEIYVYPASAKVYTADGWVTRQAMTWQNGGWKVWKLALYSHGDECVDITGGWVAAPAPDTYKQGGSKTPSVSRNADNIVVSLSGTGANVGGKLQTSKAIDLTPYTKLYITATGSGQGQWSGAGLQIYNQLGSSVARISISGVQTDREVDLSNINGDCYVSCFVGTSGTGTLSASMTVYSITLE